MNVCFGVSREVAYGHKENWRDSIFFFRFHISGVSACAAVLYARHLRLSEPRKMHIYACYIATVHCGKSHVRLRKTRMPKTIESVSGHLF